MKNSLVIFVLILLSFNIKTEYNQTGKASYYSNKFEGRRTSSGEIFRQDLMTGAHKNLKFGTMVKVTNLKNDSTIIVKINDRLSQKSGSLIDLSLKAAKQLNFVKNGYAKVKIETL